ncbi:hypothetical protein [Desulfomonile tiedjei]|nr:hypothetical protein [Desulfomonile tiedjei]
MIDVISSSHRLKAIERITAIAVILVFLCPALAAADGMAFRYGPASSLEPLRVDEQRAVIAHKDGVQRMFIAINTAADDPAHAAVWIFPVPGSPDRADVDVAAFIPELTGRDVQQEFDEIMELAWWIPLITQPHFVPLPFFAQFAAGPMGVRMGRFQGAEGITTHKEIDRWGIHAELITADSVDRLADYLRKKNVPVDQDRLAPFVAYLSDKYSLVVAWISSYEELTKRFPQHSQIRAAKRPSLYVEFPTEKPFYPMRPTSAYGKNKMEVSLYIVGWVAPDMSSWEESDKKGMTPRVRYYAGDKEAIHKSYQSYRSVLSAREKDRTTSLSEDAAQRKAGERFFAAVPEGDMHFTRVRIYGPAGNFTQDLQFSPNPNVSIKHFIASNAWVLSGPVILLILALSYISGGISGKLVFGEWKPWARTGLWNCFSIVTLVVVTWLRRRNLPAESKRAAMSGRWQTFVLGLVISVPLTKSVIFFLPDNRYLPSGGLLLLFYGIVAVELLIAAWIAMTAGQSLLAGTERKLDPMIPNRAEYIIRVFLIFLPTVAILAMRNTPEVLGVFPTEVLLFNMTIRIPISCLIIVALSLMSGLIAVAMFASAWILRGLGTAWKAGRASNSNDIAVAGPGRKPETLILGVLVCITAFLAILSFPFDLFGESFVGFCRLMWFSVITVELYIAKVLWKSASTPVSSKPRVSPAWPATIGILLPIWTLILCFVHYSDGPLKWALAAVLPLTVIGCVSIVPLRRVFRDMTDKRALASIVVVLGVLSYLAVLVQVPIAIQGRGVDRDAFAVLALILATWIVKRALKEPPTKALRFGILFSMVFTILVVGASFGSRYLFVSMGIQEPPKFGWFIY